MRGMDYAVSQSAHAQKIRLKTKMGGDHVGRGRNLVSYNWIEILNKGLKTTEQATPQH